MGILSQLQSDFTGTLILLLYRAPAILIALTLHELAHGYVALKCGDPTAQMMGRLSFNPLKHLDPIGTLFMFLFGFGWARPVPVNPRNYKHFKRDDILVSLAGVTVNFLLFFFTMWVIFAVNQMLWSPELWSLGSLTGQRGFLRFDSLNFSSVLAGNGQVVVENAQDYILSVTGNQVQLNPLTPWKYLSMYIVTDASGNYYFTADTLMNYVNTPWLLYVQRFLMFFAQINLSLCLFNLLPIPPLDGYHVVNDIFLRGRLHIPANVINILMTVLLILFMFTNVFSAGISKAVYFVQGGVAELILAITGAG